MGGSDCRTAPPVILLVAPSAFLLEGDGDLFVAIHLEEARLRFAGAVAFPPDELVAILRDGGKVTVAYHSTKVVEFDDKKIVLRTGGWKTATTKARMNQASNQFNLGYSVYVDKGQWFVGYKGSAIPFTGDTLTLPR